MHVKNLYRVVKMPAYNCSIERSQYAISFQPLINGMHRLHITARGQHVNGSPIKIDVASPENSNPIGAFKPHGVAVDHAGYVVVSESANCVSVFHPDGVKIMSFAAAGYGGVTVDADGMIILADNMNHCIHKFTSFGQLLARVGTNGSGRLQFREPTGIAFNPINNLLYVVTAEYKF